MKKRYITPFQTNAGDTIMSDRNFYYDFKSELNLEPWNISKTDQKTFICKAVFQCEKGNYVLLIPYMQISHSGDDSISPLLRTVMVDDQTFTLEDSMGLYIPARHGFRIQLTTGQHTVKIHLSCEKEDITPWLSASLIKDIPPVPASPRNIRKTLTIPAQPIPSAIITEPDITGFTPGVGCTKSPGRFGFAKGDGVLDCAMPSLGIINKMFVSGHPDYHKPYYWHYSTLPGNALWHGSYYPALEKIDNDQIDINHLHVTWAAKYGNTDYSWTYSLGTPGIITESSDGIMRLSSLEFAGNYQYVLIPGKEHSQIISPDLLSSGIDMTENFLLLFGTTEFPDIPLMITLDRTPDKIEVKYDPHTNRLSELIFHGNHRMITATPTGMECYQPITPDQTELLADLVNRCRFWSHAFMAYPVKCEEYYKIEHDDAQVRIIQKFSYRYLTDEWSTTPLELAPLPPVTSISGTTVTDDRHDYHFPTKFGYLKGAFGNTSSYTIPFMPVNRKFPLRDAKDPTPEQMLNKCMDSYFEFAEHFPADMQGYPYAGALLEPFAYTSTMSLFMKEKHRNRLRKHAAERLKFACDPQREYTYPVIDWGYMITKNPEDEQLKKLYFEGGLKQRHLWNWYERTEPFTKTKFHICYLNVGLFSTNTIKEGTPEEIANLKTPLIENDWGAGLTFYYMMLCALASGDITPIKENWELLKNVYKFFDCMHDWACMGTGYSDNAITWVEGANYGVFTGFINMAKAIGDKKELERGIYFAAKQLCLRMAILRSSIHYFNKVYHVEPWYITKSFREESNPGQQFQNVPKNYTANRFRPGGIYNLTTEGVYPEIFDAMRKFCPDDLKDVMEQLRHIFRTKEDFTDANWGKMQQISCMLMEEALDPAVSHQQTAEDIALADKRNILMKKWRGIHIFSRRLPEDYFKAQLIAWNNMKNHSVWLEFWNNVQIDDAVINGEKATVKFIITGNVPQLTFGCRKKPEKVTLNGTEIPFCMTHHQDGFSVMTGESGTLEMFF